MSKPTILMIRPLQQAKDFIAAFCDQTGREPTVHYAPILDISPRICAPLPKNTQYLLFSSVNGVTYFADQSEDRTIPALCVGDATQAAAQTAGFKADSADGTAQDLLNLVKRRATPSDGPIVYVSGATVAHDIAETLVANGYQAERRVVYAQTTIPLSQAALDTLSAPTLIPIMSPNTARAFADQVAHCDLTQVTILCISENARRPLAHLNAKTIIANAPTRSAMITALSHLL
ncbi:uroporphyrinogen-III synthase [Amylibacter sp. IMCC11727]|uniref:uroporphyrinogen-III synthase n=1 Tax=Amylibacter sp. IMCC11727 TaxID=3039851 RepID=UPI00244D9E8A|nr:uroporphyrinogen-III synthase [Amylibacter sp. IMCC11727]WGI21981.1 uroporphyrinogen-III synthase [Amylibacter sp. IMCC11727]